MSPRKLWAVMLAVSILFRAAAAVALSSTPPASYSAPHLAAPASWRPSRAGDFNPPAASTIPAAWGALGSDDSSTVPAAAAAATAAAASTTTGACRVICAADEHIDSSTAYAVHIAKLVSESTTSSVDYEPDDFAGAARLITSPTESGSDPHQFTANQPPVPLALGARSDGDAALEPLPRRFLREGRGLQVPDQLQKCDSLRLAKLVVNTCNIRGRGHSCCDAVVAVVGRGQSCFCSVSRESYYHLSAPDGGRDMIIIFRRCTGREPRVQENCKKVASHRSGNISPAAMPSPSPAFAHPAPATAPSGSASTATAPSAAAAAAEERCRPITKPDWTSRILAIVFGAALFVCIVFVCMLMHKDLSQPAGQNYDSDSEQSVQHAARGIDSSDSESSIQSVANVESSLELVELDSSQSSSKPRTPLHLPLVAQENNSGDNTVSAPAGPHRSSVETARDESAESSTRTPTHLNPNVAIQEENSGGKSSGDPLLPPPGDTRRSIRTRNAISRWLFDEGCDD